MVIVYVYLEDEDRVVVVTIQDGARPRLREARAEGLDLSKLDEAGGREVAVEREGFVDPQRPHEREARRVDERVLALVVLSQPAQ